MFKRKCAFLFYSAICAALGAAIGCGSENSTQPSEAKNSPAKQPSISKQLISSPACKVTLVSDLLEHVQINEKSNIRDSSMLRFEFNADSTVKVNEDFQTCFPPFMPALLSCRTSHADDALFKVEESTNGVMIVNNINAPWAFIKPKEDGKTADITILSEDFKQLFGKSYFSLTIERCH